MGSDSAGRDPRDADVEREIREGRKFSLADAIGRLAGPGTMKGASPVTRAQQAEAELQRFLERHLDSPAGAMSAVLLRQLRASELLLNNLDQPLVVLAAVIQRVLGSEYLVRELVRECDQEWGRVYGERPHFDREGRPPTPDDPYTVESVRRTLLQALDTLAAE
jgi:broad specificity phosphatase PhoE